MNSSSLYKKAPKISFLFTLAMIADEKAARQKKHEKQYVFHAFLLFKHRKRAFMKSEARAAFPLPTIKTVES